jgi:hypothetical protein
LPRGSWRGFLSERRGSHPDPPQSPLREGGRQKWQSSEKHREKRGFGRWAE